MAEDRKARLAALAARAGRITNKADDNETQEQLKAHVPQDEVDEPLLKRSRGEDPEAAQAAVDSTNALQQALSKAQAETSISGADALVAAAPKKVNWDLKRDIQPKLDKLEKRTQKAIVEILRTRLEKQSEID